MMRLAIMIGVALAVSACGARTTLRPKEGNAMPIKAETANSNPTVEQLLTPDSQARPKRSDEQLKRSEERREDKFDLPPA